MKNLFKSVLISLTLLVYGVSMDSLLHSALIKNQVKHIQANQVQNAFSPSYAGLFYLPSFNELVSKTSTNSQESEQTHLRQWDVVKNSSFNFSKQSIWRNELLRFIRINLSLTVKDIIFPFHTFS